MCISIGDCTGSACSISTVLVTLSTIRYTFGSSMTTLILCHAPSSTYTDECSSATLILSNLMTSRNGFPSDMTKLNN